MGRFNNRQESVLGLETCLMIQETARMRDLSLREYEPSTKVAAEAQAIVENFQKVLQFY